MTQQLIPIVNLPNLYADNCQVSWASATTLSVAAGQVRDSTNIYDIALSEAITLDGAVNGVNGLDTGALAANTWYAVFVIYDPTNANPPKTLLSTSATAPLMPSLYGTTYGAFRRIGWVKTDGSEEFLKFYCIGKGKERFYQWDVPISILSGGSSATFAAVNASVGAPKQVAPIYLNIAYTPTTAASVASIRPTGSTAAALSCPIELKSTVNAVAVKDSMVKILPLLSSGNASIDYIVTASDALSLTVAAFEDYL